MTDLTYESSSPTALADDETLVWEGGPARTNFSTGFLPSVAVAGISGLAAFLAFVERQEVAGSIIACVTVVAVCLVGIYLQEWVSERRAVGPYKLTDRRIYGSGENAPRKRVRADIEAVQSWQSGPFRGVTRLQLSADPVWAADEQGTGSPGMCVLLLNDDQVKQFTRHLLRQPALRLRRTLQRRLTRSKAAPDMAATRPTTIHATAGEATPRPAAIDLLADEPILWHGRPLPSPQDLDVLRLVLRTFLWAMIPAAIVAARLGLFGPDVTSIDLWLVIIAFAWLVPLIYTQTVGRFVALRRLRRTTYVLTALRWITVVDGRHPTVESLLLDIVRTVQILHYPTGGTIQIDQHDMPGVLTDAPAVYQLLLALTLRRGAPAGPVPPATSPAGGDGGA